MLDQNLFWHDQFLSIMVFYDIIATLVLNNLRLSVSYAKMKYNILGCYKRKIFMGRFSLKYQTQFFTIICFPSFRYFHPCFIKYIIYNTHSLTFYIKRNFSLCLILIIQNFVLNIFILLSMHQYFQMHSIFIFVPFPHSLIF